MTRAFSEWLSEEHELQPGEAAIEVGHLSWGAHGISLAGAEPVDLEARGDITIQLSRSSRLVRPGWMMRTLGREAHEEHLLHIELRSSRARLRLSAQVLDPTRLDGLAELSVEGAELELELAEQLLATCRALGGELAQGIVDDERKAPPTTAPPARAQVAEARSRAERAESRVETLQQELAASKKAFLGAREALGAAQEEVAELGQKLENGRTARRELQEAYNKLKRKASKAGSESKALDEVRAERDQLRRRVRQLTEPREQDDMKTLEEHNIEQALDSEKMSGRTGVCCPRCKSSRNEIVEMFRFGFESEHRKSKISHGSVGTACPRCGYVGRQYLPRSQL